MSNLKIYVNVGYLEINISEKGINPFVKKIKILGDIYLLLLLILYKMFKEIFV